MSERRARAGRMVGVAEGVAAAVRRRQREREPRVILFDHTGSARVVAPSAAGYDSLLEIADEMVALVDQGSAGSGRSGDSAQQPQEPSADAASPLDESAA